MLLQKKQLALLIVIRRRLTAQGNGQAALDHVGTRRDRLLEEIWFLRERLGEVRPPGKIGRPPATPGSRACAKMAAR